MKAILAEFLPYPAVDRKVDRRRKTGGLGQRARLPHQGTTDCKLRLTS